MAEIVSEKFLGEAFSSAMPCNRSKSRSSPRQRRLREGREASNAVIPSGEHEFIRWGHKKLLERFRITTLSHRIAAVGFRIGSLPVY